MAGETIRDVIIRIALENGDMSRFNMNGAMETAKQVQEELKKVSDQHREVAATSADIAKRDIQSSVSTATTNPTGYRSKIEQMQAEIDAMNALSEAAKVASNAKREVQAIDAVQGALNSGNSSSVIPPLQSPEQIAAFNEELKAIAASAGEATTAGTAMSGTYAAAGVVFAAVAIQLKLLSEALQQTRDVNRAYWQEIANDAQTAAARTQQAIGRSIGQGMRRLDIQTADLTNVEMTPQLLAAQAEREQRIRDEQEKLSNRPLAERQEIRTRIEGQGARQDRAAMAQARIEHEQETLDAYNQQREEFEAKITESQKRLEELQKPREEARVKASPLGQFSTQMRGMLGMDETGIGSSWYDSVVHMAGGTTTSDERMDSIGRHESQEIAKKTATEAQLAAQEGLLSLTEKESAVQERLLAAQKEKLTVTREEQREARMLAEQGQEALTNKMLKFGAADEATKATLRQIQAKADQGQELNHLEKGLAEQYGIGAAHQARQQSLALAQRPENADLFKRDFELQKGRQERAEQAEAAPVTQEQAELSTSIDNLAKERREEQKKMLDALERVIGTDEELVRVISRIEDWAKEKERALSKMRNWF